VFGVYPQGRWGRRRVRAIWRSMEDASALAEERDLGRDCFGLQRRRGLGLGGQADIAKRCTVTVIPVFP